MGSRLGPLLLSATALGEASRLAVPAINPPGRALVGDLGDHLPRPLMQASGSRFGLRLTHLRSPSLACGCSGTTARDPRSRRSTVLFCPWLAWSRFRVVALWDKTTPSVVMALDRALRAFGGAPTYALTDNEKTVSVDHVAGIAARNPQIVSVGRHYGLSIATCVPADPQSKGRLGGDGPDRERRPGPDRAQPAPRL